MSIACPRVVYVRRDRCSAVGRTENAGNEARLVWCASSERVRRVARELCTAQVQLMHVLLHRVIGHRDPGRVERIGLDDVRTRLEITGVDAANERGLRQRQKVVVAFLIAAVRVEALAMVVAGTQAVRLDHGAHGPVEDQNALCEQSMKKSDTIVDHEKRKIGYEAKNPTIKARSGFLSSRALAIFIMRPQAAIKRRKDETYRFRRL